MAPRRRRKHSSLAERKAVVIVDMQGASIEVHDIPADDVWLVLQALLERRREAIAQYPELCPILPEVGGSSTTFTDDDVYDGHGRIGFRA